MLREAVEGVVGDDPQPAAIHLELGQHGEQEEVGRLDAADKGVAAETQLVEVSERRIIKFLMSVPYLLMTRQFLNCPTGWPIWSWNTVCRHHIKNSDTVVTSYT